MSDFVDQIAYALPLLRIVAPLVVVGCLIGMVIAVGRNSRAGPRS
jgi:hypothetical protein